MTTKKIKILTLGDHPLFHTGVAIQTKLFIESMLNTNKFEFVSLAGAMKHENLSPIKTEEHGDSWKIFPVEGYGDPDSLRSIIRTEKPDFVWVMTDPRYWQWLWQMEDEIRSQSTLVYYHVWDNEPAPHYNKKFYDSNDCVVSISKLTESVVNEVTTKAVHERIPHTYDPSVYKILPQKDVDEFKNEHFKEGDRFTFFWNNRNSPRKNATTILWWFKEFLDEVGHSKATLLMHTDPEDSHGTNIEENIKNLGLDEGQVMISPIKYPQDKMAMLYNVVDCTINISDAEGFGLSTLESLACGTPIIVNNTGGLKEQVTDGKETFGIAIEPATRTVIGSQSIPYIYQDRVSKESFISSLKEMMNLSDSVRNEMGVRGSEYVSKEYSLAKFSAKWESLLLNLFELKGAWDTRQHKGWEIIKL